MRLEDHIGEWQRRRAAITDKQHRDIAWIKIAWSAAYTVFLVAICKCAFVH